MWRNVSVFCLVIICVAMQDVLAQNSKSKNLDFDGSWSARVNVDGADTPYSDFTIVIKHSGESYAAKYCYVAQYGAKIDCDPKSGENVHGKIGGDGVLHVEFSSYSDAKGGLADISIKEGGLVWLVTKQPEGDGFFGPNKSFLNRVDKAVNVSEHDDGVGGYRGVIVTSDKAVLLTGPTESLRTRGYLIKGDEVDLIDRSDDKNYWKVVYHPGGKKELVRWLRCEDVNKCG